MPLNHVFMSTSTSQVAKCYQPNLDQLARLSETSEAIFKFEFSYAQLSFLKLISHRVFYVTIIFSFGSIPPLFDFLFLKLFFALFHAIFYSSLIVKCSLNSMTTLAHVFV